jgi:hypothetical protein
MDSAGPATDARGDPFLEASVDQHGAPPIGAWELSVADAEADRFAAAIDADLGDGVDPEEILASLRPRLLRLTTAQRLAVVHRLAPLLASLSRPV